MPSRSSLAMPTGSLVSVTILLGFHHSLAHKVCSYDMRGMAIDAISMFLLGMCQGIRCSPHNVQGSTIMGQPHLPRSRAPLLLPLATLVQNFLLRVSVHSP